jgi:hypothetical protein
MSTLWGKWKNWNDKEEHTIDYGFMPNFYVSGGTLKLGPASCIVTRKINRIDGKVEEYSKTYHDYSCPDGKYVKYFEAGWREEDWPDTFQELEKELAKN